MEPILDRCVEVYIKELDENGQVAFKIDRLSAIIEQFNDQFGGID